MKRNKDVIEKIKIEGLRDKEKKRKWIKVEMGEKRFWFATGDGMVEKKKKGEEEEEEEEEGKKKGGEKGVL